MTYPGSDTYPGADTFPGAMEDELGVRRSATVWLDPTDPDVRSAIASGVWGKEPGSLVEMPTDAPIDTLTVALEVASNILTALTAFRVHPAGEAIEEYAVTPRIKRLAPNYAPLRTVSSIARWDAEWVELAEAWVIFGQAVYFNENHTWDWGTYLRRVCGAVAAEQDLVAMTYQFGSTITASARRAVLFFAHQLWLEAEGQECELPSRTTSVQREGIQFSMLDPQDYLSQGKTGLPTVDLWIQSVNPKRAVRPSGVWTPDSPPAVNRAIRGVVR